MLAFRFISSTNESSDDDANCAGLAEATLIIGPTVAVPGDVKMGRAGLAGGTLGGVAGGRVW
jgi:hypothetical protein